VSMVTLGIGVIDTTSLWAAGSLLYPQPVANITGDTCKDFLRHPCRELHSTTDDYFLSLLHNLLLYDELRTDIEILSKEPEDYYYPVSELIKTLSSNIKIDSIPQSFSDQNIIEAITPAFVQKTKVESQSRSFSTGFGQIAAAAECFHGFYSSHPVAWLGEEQLDRMMKPLSANTKAALHELADKDLDRESDSFTGRKIERRHSILSAVYRNLSIIARTMRYAAHSRFVHAVEKRPSAFCASPRRIELLQGYLDNEGLKSLRTGTDGFVDLFSKIGLPKSGYDFSGFAAAIKPLSLTDLTYSISELMPRKALDRVLEIRETPEARTIRRIWAERLWRNSTHALEGYAHPLSAQMRNITADGDVIQIIAVEAGSESILNQDAPKSEEANAIRDLAPRILQKLAKR
jgi:hypothetical protein